MKAGFWSVDITPAIGMEMPGGYSKSYIQGINDPLKVRAAVIEDGETTLAFAGVDTCYFSASKAMINGVRERVESRCGIPGAHVLMAASHTHSGGPAGGRTPEEIVDAPALVRDLALNHSMNASSLYRHWVVEQIATAICEAYRRRKEALLSVGRGWEGHLVFNRRFRMKNGRVFSHPGKGNPDTVEPAGPVDPEVGVLGAWTLQGDLIGCIVNYTCHATTMGGAAVSADYIGYLESTVQAIFGSGVIPVFLNGAFGDVTQVDNQSLREPEFGEKWARELGARLGAEVARVMISSERGELTPLAFARQVLRLGRRIPSTDRLQAARTIVEEGFRTGRRTTEWLFAKELIILEYLVEQEPEVEVEVQALQVGPALFLSNPAENFCETGLAIKAASPFRYTWLVGLANRCVGYVPPESAFAPDGGGYETLLTAYSNLEVSAEKRMREAAIALSEELIPGAAPQPPTISEPGAPWEFGVLGPDRE